MAIFYSPYTYTLDANKNITTTPYTGTPSGTDYNYQDNDLFVVITASAGTPYKAGVAGSRIGWTSYSSNPKPYGSGGSPAVPGIVPTSAAAAITVAVNQVLTNQSTVSAYGGSAVQVNTGTAVGSRGVTPVYTVTFNPALPAWITATYVKSVPTINVNGVDNLYNKVEVQLSA